MAKLHAHSMRFSVQARVAWKIQYKYQNSISKNINLFFLRQLTYLKQNMLTFFDEYIYLFIYIVHFGDNYVLYT